MLGLLALGLGTTSFISDALNRKAAKKQAEAAAAAQQQNIEAMNQRYTAMQTGVNSALSGMQTGMTDAYGGMQELLSPYTTAGKQALTQQQALSGAMGAEAQQAAIQGIEQSPVLQAMMAQGENAMLQNAAATGGLRGGNTQGALAQYRPQMLNQAINQQYSQLGGLSSMGLNAGNALGTAGMNMASSLGQAGLNAQMALGQAGMGMAGATGDMNTQMAMMNAQPSGFDNFLGSLMTGIGSGMGAYTGLGGTFDFGGSPKAANVLGGTKTAPPAPRTYDFSGPVDFGKYKTIPGFGG